MELHKLYGVVFTSSLLLAACGNTDSNTSSTDEFVYDQEHIENLESELVSANEQIAELKAENNEMVTFIEEYLDDIENSLQETDTDASNETVASTATLNDEVVINDGSKDLYSLTVLSSSNKEGAFPDYMISLDDFDTNKLVAINIEYKNIANGEPYRPSTYNLQVYTKDGQLLNQLNQVNGQDAVGEGRVGNTTMYWELPDNEISEIELDYVASNSVLASFSLPIE